MEFFVDKLSGKNIPENLRLVCDKINLKYPSRSQNENWSWRAPFKTSKVKIKELSTKENLIFALEDCYQQIKDFEIRLVEDFEE